MKKSDWAMIALQVFTAFVAFIGATEGGEEAVVVFMFVVAAAFINSLWIARRDRQRDAKPARRRHRAAEDELDARAILDLDARLEALERAQLDAVDAARWRALVERGEVSAPAAPLAEPVATERNRQRA